MEKPEKVDLPVVYLRYCLYNGSHALLSPRYLRCTSRIVPELLATQYYESITVKPSPATSVKYGSVKHREFCST